MLGTFSSGTAKLLSGVRPSMKLLMLLRSSSIFSAKSIRMGITFADKIGFFAMLLSKSQALFNTLPEKLMYSSNFWLKKRVELSQSMATWFYFFWSSSLALSLFALPSKKLFFASSLLIFFRIGRLSMAATNSFGFHFLSLLQASRMMSAWASSRARIFLT